MEDILQAVNLQQQLSPEIIDMAVNIILQIIVKLKRAVTQILQAVKI